MGKTSKFKMPPISICILFVLLIIWAASLIVLIYWGIATSFKEYPDFLAAPANFFPKRFTLENYKAIFKDFKIRTLFHDGYYSVGFLEMGWNTVVYTTLVSVLSTVCPCIVAYACAKYSEFKFSKFLYSFVLVVMVVPVVGNLASEVRTMNQLGLVGTWFGIAFLRLGFLGPYFLIFHAAIKGVSNTYMEAARVDGASQLRIMLQIVLPMIKGTFFGILMLQFIMFYNEYTIIMLYMKNRPTFAYALYYMKFNLSSFALEPARIAVSLVVTIPIFALFIVLQKQILAATNVGGIKD